MLCVTGIVFLATNRPYDLDEAMHRRITAVVEYRPPDHLMRQRIWENLLLGGGATNSDTIEARKLAITKSDLDQANSDLAASLRLEPDVDFGALAVKYELTGGFIKVTRLVYTSISASHVI